MDGFIGQLRSLLRSMDGTLVSRTNLQETDPVQTWLSNSDMDNGVKSRLWTIHKKHLGTLGEKERENVKERLASSDDFFEHYTNYLMEKDMYDSYREQEKLTKAGEAQNEWRKVNAVLKNPEARALLVSDLRNKGYDVNMNNVENFVQEHDAFSSLADIYFDKLDQGAPIKGFNLNSIDKRLLTRTPEGKETNYRMKLLTPQKKHSTIPISMTFKGGAQ